MAGAAEPRRLRLGISSCLLGNAVRWDGGHRRDAFLADVLGRFVEWVPVCPELELGLGVPREPIRLVGRAGTPRLLSGSGDADHSEAMRRLAAGRADEFAALGLAGHVTKSDSPSCGLAGVPVWSARDPERSRRAGMGAFVRVLRERLPLLPVEDECRLADPAVRDNFLTRIFGHARLAGALAAGMTPGGLVAFHARQKYLLLAHSPEAYRRLGRLVAGVGKGRVQATVRAYAEGFMAALAVPATRGKHANVLQHVAGHFRRLLPASERREIAEAVSGYRRGLVPLRAPWALLRAHARRLGIAWVAEQVYLDPDPAEVSLRDRIDARSRG